MQLAGTRMVKDVTGITLKRRLSYQRGDCPSETTTTNHNVSTAPELKNALQCANEDSQMLHTIRVLADVEISERWNDDNALVISQNAKVRIVGANPKSESPPVRLRVATILMANEDMTSASALLSSPFFFLFPSSSFSSSSSSLFSLSLSLLSHLFCCLESKKRRSTHGRHPFSFLWLCRHAHKDHGAGG